MASHPLTAVPLALALLGGAVWPGRAAAQAPSVPSPSCAFCGTPLPRGSHAPSCPYYTRPGTPKPGAKSSSLPAGPSLKSQVTGQLFESLLSSLFSSNSPTPEDQAAARAQAAALAAQQAEAAQAARAIAAQASFDRMMRSYKRLDDGPEVAYKALTDGNLGFKGLDGDLETQAGAARHPFDSAGGLALPAAPGPGPATPFFGDTMPVEDLRLLVEPEHDPRVVDLRSAVTFVAANLKAEAARPVSAPPTPPVKPAQPVKPAPPAKAAPKPAPDCALLAARLQGFITQRSRFQQTLQLAQSQVDTWEEANRNALLNGVKDGVEYFVGQYLEVLTHRGEAAERLEGIFTRNAARMASEGVDTAALALKIQHLKTLAKAGQGAELASGLNDWQTLAKDGLSTLMDRMAGSDQAFRALLEDPDLAKYLTAEAPGLNTLLDVSKLAAASKVFGQWAARKMPLVAALELSVKQIYNATDWYLSFQRIRAANDINGRALAAARGLQQSIDETRAAYSACSPP